MKKILIAVIVAQAAPTLLAHEMEGGSTSGLFGLKPEYIHVLVNPLPSYGLGIGVAVLLAGILLKQRALRVTGLIIVAACAAAAWPVLYFGQHGYNSLYPQIDTESQKWLDTHMSRAERFIYVFYGTAALAVAGLLCLKKFPKAATALSAVTLVASFGCLGAGAWIARAGGEVSHSEFRAEGSSPEMPTDQHGHSPGHEPDSPSTSSSTEKHEHNAPATQSAAAHTDHGTAPTTAPADKAEPGHQHSAETSQTNSKAAAPQAHADHPATSQASTNSSPATHEHSAALAATNAPPAAAHQHEQASSAAPTHSHGANNPSVSSTNWMPDTPEAIWTQLHRHQAELKTVVAAKQIDEIHAHAEAIKQLTAALVQVVHPDYKASVQKGADKVDQMMSAAHKSAHAEDMAGVAANFKQFNDALQELEQQMKKQ